MSAQTEAFQDFFCFQREVHMSFVGWVWSVTVHISALSFAPWRPSAPILSLCWDAPVDRQCSLKQTCVGCSLHRVLWVTAHPLDKVNSKNFGIYAKWDNCSLLSLCEFCFSDVYLQEYTWQVIHMCPKYSILHFFCQTLLFLFRNPW